MFRFTKRTIIVATSTALFGAAGIAYAAWYATSDPISAQAGATSLQPVVVSGDVTISTSLYPGAVGDVTFTVSNPNAFDVTVVEAEAGVITSETVGCQGAANVFFERQTLSLAVGGSSTADVTLEGAVSMSPEAPDACQGAQFDIPLQLTSKVGEDPAPADQP